MQPGRKSLQKRREARMSRNQKARNSSSSSRSPKARNSSSSSRSPKARNSSSSSRRAKARNSSSSSRRAKARNSSSSSSSPKARSSSSSSRKGKWKRKRFLNSEHQRISCFWCFLILETSRSLSQHVLQLYFVPSLLLVVFHVLHFYKQTSSQLWPSFNFICCCLSFQLSVKTCQNHLPSDQGLINHCGVLTQASLVGWNLRRPPSSCALVANSKKKLVSNWSHHDHYLKVLMIWTILEMSVPCSEAFASF